jgi:hypothetical protein
MIRITIIAALSVSFLFAACAGSGVRGERTPQHATLLGERKVDFGADRDAIVVGADEGRYRALAIRSMKSEMEMHGIRVTFGNGEVWSPTTKLRFAKGEWTRRIDLPGKSRIIRRIDFLYRSKRPRTGRATVRVFGIR